VDLRIIARGTPGFSGADLANLVNEAALMAARVNRRFVTMEDFENAKDKVMMGAERRSMVMTEDEKKLTAYHEAGHAIVGLNVPQHDPIHKATIIPRGRALGLVLSLPERDQLSVSYTKYTSKIAMAMGGRVAEELIFGKENVTSGAASRHSAGVEDRARDGDAVRLCRGPRLYRLRQRTAVLSRRLWRRHEPFRGDAEAHRRGGEGTGRRGLRDGQAHPDGEARRPERLAQGLLEYETLTGSEIQKVINGEPLNRGDDSDDASTGGTPSITAVPKTRKPKADPEGGGPEPDPTPAE
jgi:cell division protease FtsH